jgi:hypothetical protein
MTERKQHFLFLVALAKAVAKDWPAFNRARFIRECMKCAS